MDGVLDARPDLLPIVPAQLSAPLAWVKFTIASFRLSEVRDHFEAEGWDVRPLLVVRDVRAVFNSLIKKEYGRNGITSDDPPIRLRLSRFLEDWRLFRERGWPMLRYESFIADQMTLSHTCDQLGLAQDPSMFAWSKPVEQIADSNFGNQTFLLTRAQSLAKTVKPSLAEIDAGNVPIEDLRWIEDVFAEFNEIMGYPRNVGQSSDRVVPGRAVPRFENTRSYDRISRNLQRTQQALAAAVQHYHAHRPIQAESLCNQILTNKPDQIEALRLLAQVHHDRGNPEALALVNRLGSQRPGSAAYFHTFGLIHASFGRFETAAEALRQALSLRPDVNEVRMDLTAVLQQIKTRPMPHISAQRVPA